jgi:hypothetical protein
MKKKTVKKLVLAKETVRGLESSELGLVGGGGTLDCPTTTVWYRCWGTYATCGSMCC